MASTKATKLYRVERQVIEEWNWNCTFSMVYKKVGSNALFFFSSHCTEIDSKIIKHVPQLQWTKKVKSLHTSQNFITCAPEPVNLTQMIPVGYIGHRDQNRFNTQEIDTIKLTPIILYAYMTETKPLKKLYYNH